MTKKLDKKAIKKRKLIAWGIFFIALISSLVAEKFIQINAVAGIDGKSFFYAWAGFIACIIFVLFSKVIGLFLRRKEGYYKEKGNA